MWLAKSCNKEHHIKHGTLKLGSLNEYKQTESAQILDKEEGLFKFEVNLKGPIRIPNNWANTLFNGNMAFGNGERIKLPGRTRTDIHVLRQNNTTDEYTELGDSSVSVLRESLNTFIFCMSELEQKGDEKGIFPDYDDCWFIEKSDLAEFARIISEQLMATIVSRQPSDQPIIPVEIDPKSIDIFYDAKEVVYQSRTFNIDNEHKFLLDNLHKTLSDIEYTKPPIPFSKEREYRFRFRIHHAGKFIQPLTNSLIIDSDPLLHLVK